MQKMNFILAGLPGTGKGTQCEKLAETYNLTHISAGELLMGEIEQGSEVGKGVEALVKHGALVPDSIMIDLIKKQLSAYSNFAIGFIFDGFPRTLGQAKSLDEIMNHYHTSVMAFIVLEVEEKEMKKRITLRNREDDADEGLIEQRIREQAEHLEQLKKYYGNQNKLVDVDGNGTVSEVNDLLKLCINNLAMEDISQ